MKFLPTSFLFVATALKIGTNSVAAFSPKKILLAFGKCYCTVVLLLIDTTAHYVVLNVPGKPDERRVPTEPKTAEKTNE